MSEDINSKNNFNNIIDSNDLTHNNKNNNNKNNDINENKKNINNSLRKIYPYLYVPSDNNEYILKNNKQYCSNEIKTTKYTLITFLPFCIKNQFKSAFNWYFLVCAIISCIKAISPVNPMASVSPLIVVLIIGLIKEGLEEIRKYRNDKKVNAEKCLIYNSPRFVSVPFSSLQVGDILLLRKDEQVPADALILSSSRNDGLCYLRTSNLDGEAALRPRSAIVDTQKEINFEDPLKVCNMLGNRNDYELRTGCKIEVEKPNNLIYEINGILHFNGKKINFDIKNCLLRGGILKNVDYVYGIIIYTGKDTKLMQNINHSSSKFSQIDKMLNNIVIFIFVAYVLLCLIAITLGTKFRNDHLPDYDKNDLKWDYLFYYRKNDRKDLLEFAKIFSGNFIIFDSLIPISIMITTAVVKVIQMLEIEFLNPYYRQDKNDKIKCLSSSLIDEMGQVKYIFSDKTGTLTQNELEFKRCYIFNEIFGEINDKNYVSKYNNHNVINSNNFDINEDNNTNKYMPRKKKYNNKMYQDIENNNISNNDNIENNDNEKYHKDENPKISPFFDKEKLINMLSNNNPTEQQGCPFNSISQAIHLFLIGMILNHEVLTEKKKKKDNNDELIFEGANPDEVTLVSAAHELGYTFLGKENDYLIVEIDNIYNNDKCYIDKEKKIKKYKVLNRFPFESARQRSSIIVRDEETNEIFLFTKGSDSKILSNLDDFSNINLKEKTQQIVDDFAKLGLRTLCFAFKNLIYSEYKKWSKNYNELKERCLKEKEKKKLERELEKMIRDIEKKACLLGVTALEDKIQRGVKEDIRSFIEAGINFWMITGDKMDTAESIGYLCKIIDQDTEVMKIGEIKDKNHEKKVFDRLNEIKKQVENMDEQIENSLKLRDKNNVKIKRNKIKNNIDEDDTRGYGKNDYNSVTYLKNKKEDCQDNESSFEYKKNIYLEEEKNKINKEEINDVKKMDNKNNQPFLNLKENKGVKIKGKKRHSFKSEKQFPKDLYENLNLIMKKKKQKKNEDVSSLGFSEAFKFTAIKKNEEEKNVGSEENDEEKSEDEKDDNKQSSMDILEDSNNNNNNNSTAKKTIKRVRVTTTDYHKFIEEYEKIQKDILELSNNNKIKFKLFRIKYLYPKPLQENYNPKKLKIKSKFTLIIEGTSLDICISNPEASEIFWELVTKSRSLICCRASPKQKSSIVKFVKSHSDGVTLAIGDGGNDVNMIKTAHVGIGLFGKEGCQAAYNSDYAISQFRYLKRLLFVEGRFSLANNSYFSYHYFFKNLLYCFCSFFYGCISGFPGIRLFDDWYEMTFNSFMTLLPIVARTIAEEDFDPDFSKLDKDERKKLKQFLPDIYREYRDSKPFNIVKFIVIFIIGVFFSFSTYFIGLKGISLMSFSFDGYSTSFWDISLSCYLTVIICHFFMLGMDILFYNGLVASFFLAQIILDVAFFFIYNEIGDDIGMGNSFLYILTNLNFLFTLFLQIFFPCILFYILRRAEFFFGGFTVDLIKMGFYEGFFELKEKTRKLTDMSNTLLSAMKLKNNYKNYNNYINNDNIENVDSNNHKSKNNINQHHNIVDEKINKYVEEIKRKRSKNVKNNNVYAK